MVPALVLLLAPVVVVDVTGDHLDPSQTRKLVEHELTVTAVAPDDPRAAEATGRVEIATTDGKLTVRYRKVDGPIERTIPVAADPARAEIDAAYLAGNLARDEASELAKKETQDARPLRAAPSEDVRRVDALRGVLTHLSSEERAARVNGGILAFGAAGAMLGAGAYVFARGGVETPEAFGTGLGCVVMGAAFLTIGAVAFGSKNDTYEPFRKKLREAEAKGASASETVEAVEKEWATAVESEKSARRTTAVLGFVAAGLSFGAAAAMAATSDVESVAPISMALAGGINLAAGIASLTVEGQLERSYRLWRSVSAQAPEPVTAVAIGAAPLPGGGGAASLAVTW